MDDAFNKKLAELMKCIYNTCESELTPLQWDVESARVAELLVQGNPLEPALQQYLDNAPDCREEFYAMVAILRAEQELEGE